MIELTGQNQLSGHNFINDTYINMYTNVFNLKHVKKMANLKLIWFLTELTNIIGIFKNFIFYATD